MTIAAYILSRSWHYASGPRERKQGRDVYDAEPLFEKDGIQRTAYQALRLEWIRQGMPVDDGPMVAGEGEREISADELEELRLKGWY